MLKKVKIFIVVMFSVNLFNCNKTESKETLLQSVTVEDFSLRKFNQNYSSKSVEFSTEEISMSRINYSNNNLLLDKISNKIKIKSNLDLFAVGEYYSKNTELIGYELYYYDKELKHSFYKFSNTDNSYIKVFDLKDKGINIGNLEFILNYYLKDNDDISFKLHVNDDYNVSKNKGISEMEMFKTIKLFNISNTNSKNANQGSVNYQIIDAIGAGLCAGCYMQLIYGSCNEWRDCESNGICELEDISNDNTFIRNFPLVNLADNFNNYHKLRDEFLFKTKKGKKFINYYYSLSSYININSFSISDYKLIVDILPLINEAVEKINNNSSGIIISTKLNNKVNTLLNKLKTKNDDLSYQLILNDLKNEIESLKNKNKEGMINSMIKIE